MGGVVTRLKKTSKGVPTCYIHTLNLLCRPQPGRKRHVLILQTPPMYECESPRAVDRKVRVGGAREDASLGKISRSQRDPLLGIGLSCDSLLPCGKERLSLSVIASLGGRAAPSVGTIIAAVRLVVCRYECESGCSPGC